MGYQPILDSFEEWVGGHWSSRKQIVVWGAGSELYLRSKRMGQAPDFASEDVLVEWQPSFHVDQHRHRSSWAAYKDFRFVEGRDDITSVNLLSSLSGHDHELIMVGRASGDLSLLKVSTSGLQSQVVNEFATNRRPIRSATINKLSNPLLAVCLSDSSLALYPVRPEDKYTEPLDVTTIHASDKPRKLWCTRFLRSDRLAIGLGSSCDPIRVYDVTPDGLSKEPIRRFGFGSQSPASSEYPNSSSVYQLAPLDPTSSGGGAEGDIFLSGGYDGNARLHDFRSPAPFTAVFSDVIDASSAVYSLSLFGRERFIVGSSQNCLIKIFDLRLPGGKMYYAADLDPCSSDPPRGPGMTSVTCCQYHCHSKDKCRDCSIFLHPRHVRGGQISRREGMSPVYSLSSPSPFSPTFFAGIEGKVLEVDVVSVMDHHPDPIFRSGPKRTGNRALDLRRKWDPRSEVLSLPLYEQLEGNINLRTQRVVGDVGPSRKG
ncbi:hypothetical protein MMC07_008659, partial [Pseudocyphellaria aurata]|nr:hypothetical protein [Pseudocyphellaria aurata]